MYPLLKRLVGVAALLTLLSVAQVRAGGFNANIISLSWSPDGESLLFTVRNRGIFTMTPEGEMGIFMETDTFNVAPQWSPNSDAILASLTVDNQAGLFTIPFVQGAGGEPQRLTEDVGWRPQYYAPNGQNGRYSPDGEQIAFLSLREGDDYISLYTMTANGEDETRLTNLGTITEHIWSPDSTSIAFIAIPGGYNGSADLFVIGSDGENLRQLTQSGEIDYSIAPAWSPDGTRLLFTVNTPDNTKRIESIDLNGESPEVVLESGSEPLFSPDGERLLFSSYGEHWMDLSVMDADADPSDAVTIDLGETRAYYGAAWSPDSSRFAFVVYTFDQVTPEAIYIANADGSDPQLLWELAPQLID